MSKDFWSGWLIGVTATHFGFVMAAILIKIFF
jgi:hypothetical protein